MTKDEAKQKTTEIKDIASSIGMQPQCLHGIVIGVETAFSMVSVPNYELMFIVIRRALLHWYDLECKAGRHFNLSQREAANVLRRD